VLIVVDVFWLAYVVDAFQLFPLCVRQGVPVFTVVIHGRVLSHPRVWQRIVVRGGVGFRKITEVSLGHCAF